MSLNFRFAIISDLHIALPHTVWDQPSRIHLVEVSIPALEIVLERLSEMKLDFLLLPGDLTQHGEPENHQWLANRLAQLPYPTYVIPGNHDIPHLAADGRSIGFDQFPYFYQQFGYDNPEQLYYTQTLAPGVRLIALNSNMFDGQGKQIGRLDPAQLQWLKQVLNTFADELILVMIHHNVIEHLPDQGRHPMGRRYMLENAAELLALLQAAQVELIFTGHLHVQDVAYQQGIYDITTGSLISYPHPYRILHYYTDPCGNHRLQIESGQVDSVPGWATLQQTSRDWLGEKASVFMLQLLTQPPLNLPIHEAEPLVPSLRYFWAEVARGDRLFDFSHFPEQARRFFAHCGAIDSEGHLQLIDNHAAFLLNGKTNPAPPKVV
jgi:3',5'-cyclic AMP phosphodiesterase CpdA